MADRTRLLVLDLLETYARERGIHVLLERVSEREEWTCALSSGNVAEAIVCVGGTAREAITNALRLEGVEIPT